MSTCTENRASPVYEGCSYFRLRLVLATLSGKPVKITKIREKEEEPGVREFEVNFMRLLGKLTNGSTIDVSETGTTVYYSPGIITGGTFEYDCSCQRSIGYYLEPLIMMAPFTKSPINITLHGPTNNVIDPSADYYRLCVLPFLKKSIGGEKLDLKVLKRSVGNDGKVEFTFPPVRRLEPLWYTDDGLVKRIRGVAYCLKLSPSMANRMVDSARGVLNNYTPDVYITTDCIKGSECKMPGYGLSLVSESTTGAHHVSELVSQSKEDGSVLLPEELGQDTAYYLIEMIYRGGCIDENSQTIALLYMALGHFDVSKIKLGKLTDYCKEFLKLMKDFFGVNYKIDSVNEDIGEKLDRGYTEIIILPTTTSRIWKIPLNCKQCRILNVTINDTRKVKFDYIDPTMCICPPDTKKRNLEYFTSCHGDALKSCDLDHGGELIIKVPRDVYDHVISVTDKMKIVIEYSLEQPKGGVQFVTDIAHPHVYSYGTNVSTRSWCPCVDTHSELCHWSLSFTVPSHMVVICSGELVEQTLSGDGHRKTCHYNIAIPTPAPLIGFAIGSFVVYPDPFISEITHFCLPGLLPVLKNTVGFVHEVWGFYEELLSSGFPHSNYKLVFLENLHKACISYSSLGLYSNDLLYSARMIDQVQCTRSVISLSIASQYFQCYMLPKTWNDWWLSVGISQFISGLLLTKLFGSTEYQYLVNQDRSKVYDYEVEHTLPPLCDTTGGRSFNPYLCCQEDVEVLTLKAHLVVRMVQLKIGEDLLIQVFNKLLTLASTAMQDSAQWSNMMLSTNNFLKLVATVSGKDLTHFANQWIYDNGVTAFTGSYSYVRKKNMIELKLVQEPPRGYKKCVSSMTIVVQEYDGCFTHNIQVEENTVAYEIPCHSKIRKAKKRKMPLSHGEEIEIDVSTMDIEVPVLWVKVDMDMAWLANMYIQQSDTTLHHIIKYDRDAISQMKAIESLENFPSTDSTLILKEFILNSSFYYRARIKAAAVLASMTSSLSNTVAMDLLVSVHKQLFCVYPNTTLTKSNNFTDVASYFVQKELPVHVADIRNSQGRCPSEILQFIVEVIKYNDNQDNKYSDDYLRARLISALSLTLTPATLAHNREDFLQCPILLVHQDVQVILKLIVQFMNIEKVLPSYKNVITCSCLEAIRLLQRHGHIPSDTAIFKEYNHVSQYKDVRVAALTAIVDAVHCDQKESDLNYLLEIVENNNELLLIRLGVLNALAKNPPFTRRNTSSLNTLPLVERLWSMICTKLPSDLFLRNAAVELYGSLYGRLTPSCVPQGLGVVIDLKERVARSSLTTPIMTPKVDIPHAATPLVAMTTPLPPTKLSHFPETIPVTLKLPQPSPGGSLDSDGEKPKEKKHKSDRKQKKKHKHRKHKHKEFS